MSYKQQLSQNRKAAIDNIIEHIYSISDKEIHKYVAKVVKEKRSSPQNNLYHKALDVMADYIDIRMDDVKDLHNYLSLKYMMWRIDKHNDPVEKYFYIKTKKNGEKIFIKKFSTAFGECSQEEFNNYLEFVLAYINYKFVGVFNDFDELLYQYANKTLEKIL